jgi:predicted transcriptional regulator
MSQAQTLLAITLGLCSLAAVKHYLSELLPDGNGGHNLRGRVERIEARVDRIYEMLLEDKLSR